MTEEPTDVKKQTTDQGLEIPVPKKDDVFRDLTKAAKPRKKRLRLRRPKE
jgi:hypothetical protein